MSHVFGRFLALGDSGLISRSPRCPITRDVRQSPQFHREFVAVRRRLVCLMVRTGFAAQCGSAAEERRQAFHSEQYQELGLSGDRGGIEMG